MKWVHAIALVFLSFVLLLNSINCSTSEQPPQTDTTPPVISAVSISGVTDDSVTISWTTDELATSRVDWGRTTSYGNWSPFDDDSLAHNHSVTLTPLSPNTTYHCRVVSRDAAWNKSSSGDQMFTTQQPISRLTILSHSSSVIGDIYKVDGEVKNTETQVVWGVTVTATFYDTTGQMVGTADCYVSPFELAVGQTGTFTIYEFSGTITAKISSYKLFVDVGGVG